MKQWVTYRWFFFSLFFSLTTIFFPFLSSHISGHLLSFPLNFSPHVLHIVHHRCSSLVKKPPPAQVRRTLLPDDLRGDDGPHWVPAGGSGTYTERCPRWNLALKSKADLVWPHTCTHLVACLVLGTARCGPASHGKAGFLPSGSSTRWKTNG